VLDDGGGELPQHRDQVEPHPNPQESPILVRGIVCIWNSVASEVPNHVRFPGSDHRPDAVSVLGGKHGEPYRRGAVQESDEDGLRAIVGVVSRCDAARRGLSCGLLEGGTARVAGSGLEVCPCSDVHSATPERHAEPFGERFRQIELAASLRAEAVIHAVGHEGQPESSGEDREHMEERTRVAPTARRNQDAFAAFEPALVTERALRETNQGWRVRARH
jgi:hypothetical protein